MTRRACAGVLAGLAVAGLVSAAASPSAFEKSNVIVQGVTEHTMSPAGTALDVAAFLAGIPYIPGIDMVHDVSPRALYERTIREGHGNCSNLVFGMTYHLEQAGLDFEVVQILPDGFLDGRGHTLIRTRFALDGQVRVGLVDVLAAGVPTSGTRTIDRADLRAAVPEFSMRRLAEGKDDTSRYFGRYLDHSRIGVLSRNEIARYFRFIDAVYVPIGSRRAEKYLYDGLALLVGVTPKVRVESIDAMFAEHQGWRRYYIGVLWLLRGAALALPWLLATEVTRVLRARRKKS